MYVSYLYARQYDLLAIRMMLSDTQRDLSKWLPTIEPVMADPTAVGKCIELCGEKEQRIGVVMNPRLHELATPAALRAWQRAMTPIINGAPHVIPFFRCGENSTLAEMQAFFAQYPRRELGAALFGVTGLGATATRTLTGERNLRWMLAKDTLPTAFVNGLPTARKILLKDCFIRQARNADYGNVEFFTDKHLTFAGSASGIGDFLCLGETFSAGGGQPGAVAIHAIFRAPRTGHVMIEHFLSDDQTPGVVATADKFIQAATKLVNAVRRRPTEFGANLALTEYRNLVAANHSPGLPTNKKLQIVHHISRMLDVMP